MTTLTVSARRVNKPAPVRSTVVLFDATQRHPAPDDFGRGILPAARELNYRPTAYDLHLEERFIESVRLDSYERGILPL
jgi:hypothetical protein